MNDVFAFFCIVAGILLSVVVPVAVKTIRPKTAAEEQENWFWDIVWPYLKYALASLVVGFLTLVIVKQNGGQFTSWPQALMVGYLWDSTIQKIKQGLEG